MAVSILSPTFPNAQFAVEAAWGANLKGDPTLWAYSDVTADMLANPGTSWTFGKADESSQAQPANVTFVLYNTTGAYTPYLATGANYPNVRKNTPIRVRMSLDAGVTWFTRFLGFANGFEPGWDTSAKKAIVSVSASGRMRRFGRDAPLKSPLNRAITAMSPRAYWPLEDGQNSTEGAAASSGTASMRPTGEVEMKWADTTNSIPGSMPLPKCGFGDNSVRKYSLRGKANGQSSTAWSVGLWFTAKLGPSDLTPIIASFLLGWGGIPGGSNAAYSWGARISSGPGYTGAFDIITGFNNETVVSVATAKTLYDGQPHYVLVTAQQSGNQILTTVYLDGVAYTTGAVAPATNPWSPFTLTPVDVISVGYTTTAAPDTPRDPALQVGHVHVFDRLLTQAEVTAVYAAGGGYVGETATDRLTRLCAEEATRLEINSYEDFEDTSYAFPISGTWARDNTQKHAGLWSFKSAAIGNSATTDAVVTVPATANSMTVWYKVSSESGFDFFRILRDGVQSGSSVSGEVGWTKRTVDVKGVTAVTFRYTKDAAAIGGLDAAWIDDLSFVISPVLMGAQSSDTLLDLLRECESADHGVLYDGVGPGLSYLTRDSVYNASAAMTIDAGADQLAPPFQPVDDDQRIRNKYTFTRKNGSSATFEQQTGPLGTNTIGIYDASESGNVSADDANYQHAGWLTHLGTVEGFRYPTLNLNLLASPSLAASWLNTKLFGRIDVTNVSSKATQHPPETISLILEGYTEKVTPFEWTVTANCAPFKPNVVDVLDSTTPRLECGACTLNGSLTTTATSVPVLITDECVETFASGSYPITINGEDMTVTAVSAAAGSFPSRTQTLTVTRSVNGVVKTHASGAEVHVKNSIVSAL